MFMLFAPVAAVVTVASTPVVPKQAQWPVYTNARYGTRISYPRALFRRGRESDNGDGIRFTAADGATLAVYGSRNIDGLSPRAFLAQQVTNEAGTITYRTAGANFVVLSGTREGRIFYDRFLFGDPSGVVHAYSLEYPRRAQGVYGPVIARLSRSLSWVTTRADR